MSEDARRRFEREAQVIARLRSPRTVDLFDFGVAADGGFYYVMELLEGLDAETLVRRTGPVPAARAIYLLRQVCHSLSEAESWPGASRHQAGQHLSLPLRRGIRLRKSPRFRDRETHTRHRRHRSGAHKELSVHGTPAYIAPEQALGEIDLDGRADIYATGCVGYWLLTGQLVFDAPTPMALLLHHAQTAPVPSARTELPIPDASIASYCRASPRTARSSRNPARELSRLLAEIEARGRLDRGHGTGVVEDTLAGAIGLNVVVWI